jgi:hypothetical protein
LCNEQKNYHRLDGKTTEIFGAETALMRLHIAIIKAFSSVSQQQRAVYHPTKIVIIKISPLSVVLRDIKTK